MRATDDVFDLDVRVFSPTCAAVTPFSACSDDCDTCDGTECASCPPWSDDCYTCDADCSSACGIESSERPC
jgi:hypothetical protein